MSQPEGKGADLGKKIQEAEFANILKKLREGKTLSARESKLAYEMTAEGAGGSQKATSTAEELADLFGLTKVRIHQLAKEGIVVKLERGAFDLLGSVRGYVAFLKTRKSNQYDVGEDDGESYGKHRARLTGAKADMAEIEAEAMKGRFHEAGAVETVWTDMLMNARSKLLAIPPLLAPKWRKATTLAKAKDILEAAIVEALAELATYDPDRITSEYLQAHRAEVDAPAEAESESVG